MKQESTKSRRLSISSLIGTFFGGAWAIVGCIGFTGPLRVVLMMAAGVLTLVLIARIVRCRSASSHNQMFRQRPYLIAVFLEAAGIVLATYLLPRLGSEAYLIEVIGLIVGLHFIGLWKASQAVQFLLIAAGMCVFSAGAMVAQSVLHSAQSGLALTGFGNALVLLWGAGSPHKGREAA